MVGLSIMGATAPSMMTMSIAPFEAQKRAQNLGIAELQLQSQLLSQLRRCNLITEYCSIVDAVLDRTNSPAITVATCTEGENKYVQSVSQHYFDCWYADVQATVAPAPC